MIPETIILLTVGVYLASVLDFDAPIPVRVKNPSEDALTLILPAIGGLFLAGAIVFDAARILPAAQEEKGWLNFNLILNLDREVYLPAIIVTAVCAVLAAVCFIVAGSRKKNAKA